MEDGMKAKDRMKSLRLGRGLSQRELSEQTGINLRTIQNYEQGASDLNKAEAITIWRLSEALGCDMENLIDKGSV